jgi:carbonic anhydrase/acetyltransferase-like protein (isoleucine patch superfamily)
MHTHLFTTFWSMYTHLFTTVGAICHGCVLEEESMIGAGAQVMDGARVQRHGVVCVLFLYIYTHACLHR